MLDRSDLQQRILQQVQAMAAEVGVSFLKTTGLSGWSSQTWWNGQ